MKILSMSGYVPEEICDTVRFNGYHGERNISRYCGYANDFISEVIHNDRIDGAVFPHTCDSSRIIKSYLNETDKFIYQLNVPLSRDRAAITYFADILRDYKSAVERHYNISIDNIPERLDLIGKRNKYLAELYSSLDCLKYSEYLSLIHQMLTKPLFSQLDDLPEIEKGGGEKPVFLVGSYLSCVNAARMIEENGMTVIADDLPESGRLISPVSSVADGDIFEQIAKNILCRRSSPTFNDFSEIIRTDMEIIRSKNIRGVIFVLQKYCEPYNFLYSVYKKALDEADIPSVKISLTDSEDDKNAALALESFSQII